MTEQRIGQYFGRYQIARRLGRGGMAEVYQAVDTLLKRNVALKIISQYQEDPAKFYRRFKREARALAQLSHPHILKILDFGEQDGLLYLVMEYMEGGTLSGFAKPMPYQRAVRLLLPITDALHYAHQHGIIHRDVKPSNILINHLGQPMLADFGIAKLLEPDESTDLTIIGNAIGTPGYMSPEQGQGQKVDARTDIYALGVVFYELVTGVKPYTADTPMAVLHKQLTEPFINPRSLTSRLPQTVSNSISRALARVPEKRHANMAELTRELEMFAKSAPSILARQSLSNRLRWTGLVVPFLREKTRQGYQTTKYRSGPRQTLVITMIWLLGITIVVFATILGFSSLSQWLQQPFASNVAATQKVQDGLIAIPFTTQTLQHHTLEAATSNISPTRLIFTSTALSTPTPTLTLTKTLTPTKTLLSLEIVDSKNVKMHLIPSGEFMMGSENHKDDEKPAHSIYLDAYYMDIYEVTNILYKSCADIGECYPHFGIDSKTHSTYYTNKKFDDYPVIGVNWQEAETYCEWRDARLPTEAEWEKAARGISEDIYPWGNDLNCQKANFLGCNGDTTQVGSHPLGISSYGIYDLSGNVWEWVADWYDSHYYRNSPTSNPQGPAEGIERIIRGGSWNSFNDLLRSAHRGMSGRALTFTDVGFRCVRSAP